MSRYNDWDITQRHAEIVNELKPGKLRTAQVHTVIPGVLGRRITKDLREGIYLMPMDSRVTNTYSSVHDVMRRSLLVASIGITTTQSLDPPVLMKLAERLRNAFAAKRVVEMNGELYSSHEISGYDVDDDLARRADVIQIVLTSLFREDR